MRLLLILSTFIVHTLASRLNLTVSSETWVTENGQAILLCRSSGLPISSCIWSNPIGTSYPLAPGLNADAGRIQHYQEKENMDCGILLTEVTSDDFGQWTCLVGGANEQNEVSTDKGITVLKLAVAPGDVQLDQKFLNISGDSKSVACFVESADPKPTFHWYIDEEELSEAIVKEENNDGRWTQTLTYQPHLKDDNKTLRCVVEHVALGQMKEASAVLSFTDAGQEIIQMQESIKKTMAFWPYLVAGVVLVVFVGMFAFLIVRRRNRNMDEEAATKADELDKEGSDESKNVEIELTDKLENDGGVAEEQKEGVNGDTSKVSETEAVAKRGFGERFASFFTLSKTKDRTKDSNNEELKENGEVDGTHIIVQVEGIEGEDKENEKTDEEKEKTDEEKEKTDEEKETPKKESRMTKFLKLFKFGSTNKEEEKVDQSNLEEKEEAKENEEEKQIEFEPEDKEKVEEEVKEQPKHTDV